MGGQLVHAHVRRLPPPRRTGRRPARAQAGLPRGRRRLHGRFVPERDRRLLDVADPGARPPGLRRRAHRSRRALDPDDDVRRGRGPDEGARRVGGDRHRWRRGRPAARRDPRRPVLLAVDLLRQRARRDRHVHRVAHLRARVTRRRRAPELRRPGRGHGDRGTDRARLRDRERPEGGLDVRHDVALGRARARAPERLRRDRAAPARAARPARHLHGQDAARGERDDAARRLRPLRDVLLQHALRPARARLLAASGRPRLPPGHRRDRHRRGALAAGREETRHPHDLDHRHDDRRRSGCSSCSPPTRTGRT